MKVAMPERLGKRKLPPAAPQPPDWPKIKVAYRAGMKSVREIARVSTAAGRKVSHVAIMKRAEKEGWDRDLKGVVKAAIERRLALDAVTGLTKDVATDDEIVDAASRQGADVIRSQRNDIGQLRRVVTGLASELAAGPEEVAELKAAIIAGTTPAKDASAADVETAMQRRSRLMKLIGLQSRAVVAKDLSQATGKLISLERQAFGLNEGEAPDSIEERLKSLEVDADD